MTTPADGPEDLLDRAPVALAERVRSMGGRVRPDGQYVVCWLRQAVRDHDNPALDTALWASERLGVPAFVYQGLDERHPYASDRLHQFQLEGARDLAEGLSRRGVGYVLHVSRPGHRGPHLRTLASGAALVVTEDVPVEPLLGWSRRLAEATGTAVWSVDSHCVLPMNRVKGSHDRAHRFRTATHAERLEALQAGWADRAVVGSAWIPPELPFEPVDPRAADLSTLVASCDIDHGVAPVPDTPGGMRAAALRWSAFLTRRLDRYARDRNDASRDGVSRMSGYLHFGHISPFRMAWDAWSRGGPGADKFLDEMLVWRELAWHVGRRHPEPAWEVLPDWAQRTLRAHADDPRDADLSWETLARSRTGDALWDRAQDSLRVHGELHNNLRMTWGKQVLRWTGDPARALRLLVDLNHRFAIDGRDPNSHLGLLWCLGGFDRPFSAEQAVFGAVRPRDTQTHAARLDLEAYTAHVRRPRRPLPVNTVVIGAGLAGLMCARTLSDHGEDVVVLDKSRGPGGRTATRRGDGVAWDHGAPRLDLELTDPRLVRWVASWVRDGRLVRWTPRSRVWRDGRWASIDEEPRASGWVVHGGSNRLAKHLATDLVLKTGTQVQRLFREGASWAVHDARGDVLARGHRVVVAMPAPQAAQLVQDVAPELARPLGAVRYAPQLTALAHGGGPEDEAAERLVFEDHPVLACAIRTDRAPGRPAGPAWVLHATTPWSQAHLEQDRDAVGEALWAAFAEATGARPCASVSGHRWRYARVVEPVGQPVLHQADGTLVACGDGLLGDGASAALRSGLAAAGWVLGR